MSADRFLRMFFAAGALAIPLLFAIGCASAPAKGTLVPVGVYQPNDLATLQKLYAEHGLPLVVIGRRVYIPSVQCTCDRERSGAAEARRPGAATEQRAGGAATENRIGGGAGEQRGTGGAGENRAAGGAAE